MLPEEKVSFYLQKLDHQVTDINAMFDQTSTKTMADFLVSYKDHMNAVYRNLKLIKTEVEHEKFQMRRHQRIKSLTEKV